MDTSSTKLLMRDEPKIDWRQGVEKLKEARLEVQRRALTLREAKAIMGDILASPAISGYSRAEWTGRHDVFALVDLRSGALLGATLVHHLNYKWCEVAVVFIRPQYRNHGLGSYMLRASIRSLAFDHKRIIVFFKDKQMEMILRSIGFDIYDSVSKYWKQNALGGLFVGVVYKIQWLANLYRLREIRRKKKDFGTSYVFRLGLLDATHRQPL